MPHISHRLHARCAGSGAAAPFKLPGIERKYERSRPFAIRHLFLDLTLDFKEKSLSGVATLSFVRAAKDATELNLDAVGFEIEAVRVDTGDGFSAASFDYDGDTLRVGELAEVEQGRVEIRYRVVPRRGIYFLEPDAKVKDRPRQVWTQCQDEDARHWFPCHDKPHVKMTTELKVTLPHGCVALSNGELVSSHTPASNKPWVYHFRLDQPHPSYLVTLVAGEFAVIEDRDAELQNGASVPVHYYVPPKRRADVKRSFGETPRMIELFSRVTGVPFPWSRYSQIVVSDFIFGGMENTTASTMYEHVLLDERAALDVSSNDLVAHELAHQWFGDYVTCRDWSHAWLNEGFATFLEHIEREDRLGREEYDFGVAGDLDAYLNEANERYQRPIVCRDYDEPIDLFDRHLYEKGGLVLHMLRRELGDDVFWAGVRSYLETHAHGIVETNDLQRALEAAAGRSLERFFDHWVYRPGHPDLKVKLGWEDGLVVVSVTQAQKAGDTAIFAFELEIEIGHKGGALTRHKKSVSTANDSLVVELAERPEFVVFDPELRVTTQVRLDAPSDFLRAALAKAPRGLSRARAAEALSRRDEPATIRALGAALDNSKELWMVRAEAARSLGKIRAEAAFAELVAVGNVAHPKVRRAVASALGNFKLPQAATILTKLARSDRSYLVMAEAARALGRSRQPGALKTLVGLIDRPSWADVARAGAIDGLAALRDESALPELMSRTRYGVPTRGRRAAIHALAQISDTRSVREHLEELLDDKDPHLKIEVVAALQTLGVQKSRGVLRRVLDRELDGRVLRRIREALRDAPDAGVAERKRLSDELEAMRGDLVELKTRLSKVEVQKRKAGSAEAPVRAERRVHKPASRGSASAPQGARPSRRKPKRAKRS